jgi:hypothetical protein
VVPAANEEAVSVDGDGDDDDEEPLATSAEGADDSAGKSPPAAPAHVKGKPKDTAALLAAEREKKVTQAKTAEEQKLEMTKTAVSNNTSITTPIRPEVDKSLTDYKTIFDNVENTVNGYLNYDVGKTDSDPSYKPEPSYPLTSFALVFNNNFNWNANTTDPEYPISPYNLQSKLPALRRIYETRHNLNEASKKIIDNVRKYVTNIIDQQVRTGGPDANAANQSAFLSEIQKLLQTSEFNDATSEKIFTDIVKKDLGLNINDFYMNEIWTNFIKPYGDLKRFVEAIINTNSIIRKQIDGFIKTEKSLATYKATTIAILSQIEQILDNVNTQNGVFNNNILAIAFDLLFLPALFKRKYIATSGLGKSKEEYEKIIKLLVDGDEKITPRYIGINTRISEFLRILNDKKKFFAGFKKLSTQDNQTIINDFKRLLCDDIATQSFYSTDIGKNLPPGELKQNILMLFKLIKDSFERECAECSTLLNCSGPKLQIFLENSKKIKGLLNGPLGGIIGSVTSEISDLESKINNVIKSAAFTFDLYGVTSTFNEVNFDIIKQKLTQTNIEDVRAKLQSNGTTDNTEDKTSQLAVYASVLKNNQYKLPSFTVKAFNSVSMDNLSEGYNRAAAASRREIDAAAAADADKWWADKRKEDKAKKAEAAKANLAATSAASSGSIAPGPIVSGENAATSNIEAVVVDEGAAAALKSSAVIDAGASDVSTVPVDHDDNNGCSCK